MPIGLATLVGGRYYGVVSPWRPLGRGPGVLFTHDNTTFYSGNQSQRIIVRQEGGLPHGVAQGPLALRCGRRYAAEEVHCREEEWQTHEVDGRLYLSLVNRHRHEPFWIQVTIGGGTVQLEGAGHRLHGPSGLSGNSITNPDVVRIEPLEPFLAGNDFACTIPAHSATVLELCLAPGLGLSTLGALWSHDPPGGSENLREGGHLPLCLCA